MTSKCKFGIALAILVCSSQAIHTANADDLLDAASIDQLAGQKYWQIDLPVPAGDCIARTALLDDNIYVLTKNNIAFSVHTLTGITRWARPVAAQGEAVWGPTHSKRYAFFTSPAAVKVLNRRSGDLIGEPRRLRGVIITLDHDMAEISIGRLHGVSGDDILSVGRVNIDGEMVGEPVAKMKVVVVGERKSKGRVIRESRTVKIVPGMAVAADVLLPLEAVKLPFAASSPAVADEKNIYVGAANERLYSIRILTGFENWRVMTPRTLSSPPVVTNKNEVYYGGQDGLVVACSKDFREKIWSYATEGPIFHPITVADKFVYAVSNDRLLYCLDRKRGHRVWRKRFDNPPDAAPALDAGTLYQRAPGEGLFALDAATGKNVWLRKEGGRFLMRLGDELYLASDRGEKTVSRVEAATGKTKRCVATAEADFVDASQEDQVLILTSKSGRMMCIRPKSAPRLKPSDLAAVLRDDAKIAEMKAQKEAKAKAADEAKKAVVAKAKPLPEIDSLEDDDWLTSKSTAKPAGGHDLVGVDGKKAEKDDEDEADVEDEADEEEDDDVEEDEGGEDEGWDDDEEDEEEDSDEDEDL